jgi:beta-carotene 3-hydroxylase
MIEASASGMIVAVAVVVLMEGVAYVVHRHVMHGWGWRWHRSHHEPHSNRLEINDLYAVVFAGISLLCFTALADVSSIFWWVGLGMVGYGVLYGLLHDGLVHRRLPFMPIPRSGYLKHLIQAHRLHHAVREKNGATSFGFLYAPPLASLKRQLKERRQAS